MPCRDIDMTRWSGTWRRNTWATEERWRVCKFNKHSKLHHPARLCVRLAVCLYACLCVCVLVCVLLCVLVCVRVSFCVCLFAWVVICVCLVVFFIRHCVFVFTDVESLNHCEFFAFRKCFLLFWFLISAPLC